MSGHHVLVVAGSFGWSSHTASVATALALKWRAAAHVDLVSPNVGLGAWHLSSRRHGRSIANQPTPGATRGTQSSMGNQASISALREYISNNGSDYDAVVFVGIDAAPALGLPYVRDRAVLIPLLSSSNENLSMVRAVLNMARAVGAVSRHDRDVCGRLKMMAKTTIIVPAMPEWSPSQGRQQAPVSSYVGPVSFAECCDRLFACWSALRDRPQMRRKTLHLVGPVEMAVPQRPDVELSECATLECFDRALGLPDVMVTASLTDPVGLHLTRAFQHGIPALVPSQNRELAWIVETSGGGLTYENAEQFIHNVNELMESGRSAGESGRSWIKARLDVHSAEAEVGALVELMHSRER